ncbi:MAG: hypothetical protein EXR28_12485 [Betaproteobacteria bacterium]|nr:hypothetical protein [Betaproteobacteria bacterium]
MQVIPLESRQLTQFTNQIRDGVIKAYRILEGEISPNNFSCRLVNISGKFFSPRHRHNFDQIRFQLEGEFDYDADGCLKPGCAGYFPEGVRYGPQTADGDTWNLLVQFGGASGGGFTPEHEEERGAGELKARGGTFEKGVFTYYKPDGTKVNQDAYEAIWEYVNGRPLVYPKPRYEKPVLMNSNHYEWVPDPGQAGVSTKVLGVFSERQTKYEVLRVEAGATMHLEANSLYFVLSGKGETGGKPYIRRTTIRTEPGDRETLRASEVSEMVHLKLPGF